MADYLKVEPRLTVEQKTALAGHLAASLNAEGPDGRNGRTEDFVQAESILRLLAWNGEPPIVDAMARAAALNPHTPRSLAWALANEDDVAAERVLEVAGALSDADLVSIVQSSPNLAKLQAVARRPAVSADVSRSLAHHGDEATLQTLLANTKADIPDDAYNTALDRFGQVDAIVENIIDREAVSPAIVQRVSESGPSPQLAKKIAVKAAQTQAASSVPLAAAAPPSASVSIPAPAPTSPRAPVAVPAALPGFIDEQSDAAWETRLAQMVADKSLNEWALVRQLCLGNFDFFARALSALTKVPKDDVISKLLGDPSTHLPALWKAAALPADWLAMASAALAALVQIDRSTNKTDRDLFSKNIINRTQANLKSQKVVLSSLQQRFFGRPGSR